MRLILDRIEKNSRGVRIAVFEASDENIEINELSMPDGFMDKLFVGAIIDAQIENEKIISAQILLDETEEKRASMRSRLDALKRRNKK